MHLPQARYVPRFFRSTKKVISVKRVLNLTQFIAASSPTRSPLTFSLHVGRPERQVVPEELHDERGVLVALLGQRVQLRDGVVEGGLREAAGAVGRVQDLVVEHGEVEGQAQPEEASPLILGHFPTDFQNTVIDINRSGQRGGTDTNRCVVVSVLFLSAFSTLP